MKKWKQSLSAYIFLAPHFIGFALFFLVPVLMSIRYSFTYGVFDSSFAGLENYKLLFENQAFQLALKNNLLFMAIGLPLIVIIAFFIAYGLYRFKMPTLIKLAFVLPIFIPSGSAIGFYRRLFDPLLASEYAMVAVLFIFIWKNIGYNILIYMAAFASLDKDLLDHIRMDGANAVQTLRHVIFPITIPTTVFVVIVSVVNSFKVFKDTYLLQGNYPNRNIYMLQHFMNNKFRNLRIETLSSAATVLTVALLLIIFYFMYMENRHLKRIGNR